MKALVGLVVVLAVALGFSLTLLVSREPKSPSPPSALEAAEPAVACGACDGGECVQGRCLQSGQCSRPSDCDDGNECTAEWCEGGTCVGGNRGGPCAVKDRDAGVCLFGFCELPLDGCLTDVDCGSAASACVERRCVDGQCQQGARPNDTECSTPVGRPGRCNGGACLHSVDGERRLRFVLHPDETEKLERDLEARLSNNLRYDLKAVLVPLHAGGYNLVFHNRKSRAEVRGLCDPSFIAFDLADYTAATNWKSVHLQVWLEAGGSGWTVPTRGSRLAVDQGRADSLLGMYGVVNVRTFRIWLERAFHPIDERGVQRQEIAHEPPLAPFPETPDAGAQLVDAGPPRPTSPAGPSGRQALSRAWDEYGDGNVAEARRLAKYARGLGAVDPELELLLAP